MINNLLIGDCRNILPSLPEKSVKGNDKTFRNGGTYTKGRSFYNDKKVIPLTHGNKPNETGLRNKRDVWTVK